jgi:methylthioribose-1-phosphate isomerase
MIVNPITWKKDHISIIDQTVLPGRLKYEACRTVSQVREAIQKLKVRGAPLIGIAGAYGFLLGIRGFRAKDAAALRREALHIKHRLISSRPTAVNLAWAVRRMFHVFEENASLPRAALLKRLEAEAHRIFREDADMCRRMGAHGAVLLRSGDSVLTVCNAGALATSGGGTALSVFYRAHEQGKRLKVYACETRPLLQGARLTTWELKRHGLDVTLICDNMAARLMQQGRIRAVFVGADRIAANGDFANKIGTYGLAVLARYHGIPFYAVAPSSTFDLTLATGAEIPIEERDPDEITTLHFERPIAPAGVKVYNPSFDMTPAFLVTGIVTEQGVLRRPFSKSIRSMYGRGSK